MVSALIFNCVIRGGVGMYIALSIMLAAAMFVLFMCGFYVGVIKEKYSRTWLYAVPITVALLMFNIIWAIVELSKTARWQ